MDIAVFFEENADGRNVGGSGDDVVGQLTVGHAAVLPNDFFVKRETNGLRDTADDLAFRKNWMEYLADFLEGDEVVYGSTVGSEIDRDFGNVHRPGIRAVGFALIFLVVPENTGRSFVAGERLECASGRNEFAAGVAEFEEGERLGQKTGSSQSLFEAERGRGNKFTDNHGGAGGHGGTAVGNRVSVGLSDDDIFVGETESVGRNLAEDSIGALAEFGTGDENADLAVLKGFDADDGGEVAFAGAGEAGAMKEGGDAHALLP